VRGADGHRERVDLGLGDEFGRLVGIGDQHVMGELALEAVAILSLAHAALQRPEHAKFALDRHADQMRHVDDPPGHAGIIFIVARGLGVLLERTIHHHRGEAVLDG
jgi:hypothetical protein